MKRVTLPVVLHNPKILLIGGGAVALQKAKVMRRNEITFDIITAGYSDEILALKPSLKVREITAEDCGGYSIIIDATGNDRVTAMLSVLKKEQNFLLNVVDVPEKCDFFFAALIEHGPLKIAVSSSGASPAIAQAVRDKIKRMLPSALAALGERGMQERLRGIIRPKALGTQARKELGRVYLVGCGTGDVGFADVESLSPHTGSRCGFHRPPHKS